MWQFWRKDRRKADPKKTSELSPTILQESARRQDLFALLELFLVTRVQNELGLEEKRAEVSLKMAEAEAQTKLRLAELREQRRQLRASRAADRNRSNPRDPFGRIMSAKNGCEVCINPANPRLTVEQIRAHHAAGHSNGGISGH